MRRVVLQRIRWVVGAQVGCWSHQFLVVGVGTFSLNSTPMPTHISLQSEILSSINQANTVQKLAPVKLFSGEPGKLPPPRNGIRRRFCNGSDRDHR